MHLFKWLNGTNIGNVQVTTTILIYIIDFECQFKKTVWCVDEMNIRSNFFCSATTKNKTHKHAQNFISILLSLLLFSNISWFPFFFFFMYILFIFFVIFDYVTSVVQCKFQRNVIESKQVKRWMLEVMWKHQGRILQNTTNLTWTK